MNANPIDDLQIYRGHDYAVTNNIVIRQPTLQEVCEFGEVNYYSTVFTLTSTPSDYKVQLQDVGIDFEKITEFDFFILMTRDMGVDKTRILFGDDFDLSKFKIAQHQQNGDAILVDTEQGTVIDFLSYDAIAKYLRKMHFLEKNTECFGNEYTKKIMMEQERRKLLRQKNKPHESMLLPLISSMTNCADFKYSYDDVWQMKIYPFMDAVRRIQKRIHYDQTMAGVYAGTVDIKKLKEDQDELSWLGKLQN